MRALLMHDLGDDRIYANALTDAGHEVVRCGPAGPPVFPCDGTSGACPLDATVEVAVVIHDRPTTDIGVGEAGVVCALRDRVPLVAGGNHTHSAFGEAVDAVAVSPADVGSACERAVAARMARAGRALSTVTGVEVTVTRHRDQVRVVLPADTSERVAVLAHQAARREFPTARSIAIATAS